MGGGTSRRRRCCLRDCRRITRLPERVASAGLPFDGSENRGMVNRSELDTANFWHQGFATAVGAAQEERFSQDPPGSIYLLVIECYILSKWSGRKDLNLRPPGPEPGNKSN
jgi:hypothetical protein